MLYHPFHQALNPIKIPPITMPTQLQKVRRSSRNAGKKIKTPKFQHDLYKDPPTTRVKKKPPNKPKKVVAEDPVIDKDFVLSEEEEEEELLGEVVEEGTGASAHPSKNYTKPDLYHRWVRSRNFATDYKNELELVQK